LSTRLLLALPHTIKRHLASLGKYRASSATAQDVKATSVRSP